MTLTLRPLGPDDEAVVRAAGPALAAEDFTFAHELSDDVEWGDYVAMVSGWPHGVDLPDGFVATTFLVAEVDGAIVGRVSIRHELNDFLLRLGGHVGYAVLAEHRRRGYATEILRQALAICAGLGIDPALVTCDDDNVGSRRVIESCGGVLEDIAPSTPPRRRYWVPTS